MAFQIGQMYFHFNGLLDHYVWINENKFYLQSDWSSHFQYGRVDFKWKYGVPFQKIYNPTNIVM